VRNLADKITAKGFEKILRDNIKKPHHLGYGLYLRIQGKGSRLFSVRYTLNKKTSTYSLGSYHPQNNTLTDARRRAAEIKATLARGKDPHEDDQLGLFTMQQNLREVEEAKRLKAATFERMALDTIVALSPRWSNEKTAKQWMSSLEAYAFPVIGHLPISDVNLDHVEEILQPIWYQKTETADRVRRRIEAVINRAKTKRLYTGPNPASWRGNLEFSLPSAEATKNAQNPEELRHHEALHHDQLPEFMVELQKMEGVGARALEMCIMYSTRTNSVLKAKWHDFDLGKGLWTIPANMMKKRISLEVPLTSQACELLARMSEDKISEYVFPHTWSEKHFGNHLSQAGMSSVLKRMQKNREWLGTTGKTITTHGFRATFRTYIANKTEISDEVINFAMGHKLKDKTHLAYQRGDFLEKRKVLMQLYSDYAYELPTIANIIAAPAIE
tara:strand:- start:91 stop:1419 length:1329 start_codon:yes stop_codon:yes gene_type:complete